MVIGQTIPIQSFLVKKENTVSVIFKLRGKKQSQERKSEEILQESIFTWIKSIMDIGLSTNQIEQCFIHGTKMILFLYVRTAVR